MLEVFLTFFLVNLLPDIAMTPVIIGGYAAFEDIKKTVQAEDEIGNLDKLITKLSTEKSKFEIYIKKHKRSIFRKL